jgi:hypothetical protein
MHPHTTPYPTNFIVCTKTVLHTFSSNSLRKRFKKITALITIHVRINNYDPSISVCIIFIQHFSKY